MADETRLDKPIIAVTALGIDPGIRHLAAAIIELDMEVGEQGVDIFEEVDNSCRVLFSKTYDIGGGGIADDAGVPIGNHQVLSPSLLWTALCEISDRCLFHGVQVFAIEYQPPITAGGLSRWNTYVEGSVSGFLAATAAQTVRSVHPNRVKAMMAQILKRTIPAGAKKKLAIELANSFSADYTVDTDHIADAILVAICGCIDG